MTTAAAPSPAGPPPAGLSPVVPPVASPVVPPVALPACAGEAVAMARAGLAWLARADAASLPGVVQAGLLRDLEVVEAAHTAARARVLAAFAAQGTYLDDGSRGRRPWLCWQARVTRGAAGGALGWMYRLAAHPRLAAALAGGSVSASWARQLAAWSDRLGGEHREEADRILLAAAAGGWIWRGWRGWRRRSRPGVPVPTVMVTVTGTGAGR